MVNLAARLCGEAKGGQILVDRKVAAAIEGRHAVRPFESMPLKGFDRPVPVYLLG